MSGSVLVDTNVLAYAYDRSEPEKQERALEVLDSLGTRETGVISTQVLAEFFVAVTRKIATPLSVPEAYERVENYLRSWTVLDLTGMIVLEAARGVRAYQFNFWDARIWATAHLNQIPIVLSEDFNTDQVTEGVRFVNPFAPDFRFENCQAEWVTQNEIAARPIHLSRPLHSLTNRTNACMIIGGGGCVPVGVPVFKTGAGCCTSGHGGFDSHPLPLNQVDRRRCASYRRRFLFRE